MLPLASFEDDFMSGSREGKIYYENGNSFTPFNQSHHPVGNGACAGFVILGKIGASYLPEALDKKREYEAPASSWKYFIRKLYISDKDFRIHQSRLVAEMYTEMHKS